MEAHNKISERIKAKQIRAHMARSQDEKKIEYSPNKMKMELKNLDPIEEESGPRNRLKRRYSF